MTARPPTSRARSPRDVFRRRRARAWAASAVVLLSLSAVGWLLVAPQALAGVRLYGVAVSWWATIGAYALGLLALALAPRAGRRTPRSP